MYLGRWERTLKNQPLYIFLCRSYNICMVIRMKSKNLRHQVVTEKRRWNLFFYSLITVILLCIAMTMVFGDMGFIKYVHLQKSRRVLEKEIADMKRDNKAIKSQVEALKKDPYYIEKKAREEYGLAKKGEYIFQFSDNGR